MKNINEILRSATPNERGEINKILNKLVPKQVIEENLELLLIKDSKSLLLLLKTNEIFKIKLSIFVTNAEDLLNTAIYKIKEIDSSPWEEFILNENNLDNFSGIENAKKIIKLINDEFKKYKKNIPKNSSFSKVFSNLLLSTKIKILKMMSPNVFNEVFKTNSKSSIKKTTKEEFIKTLHLIRTIRNFIYHSTFILNNEWRTNITTKFRTKKGKYLTFEETFQQLNKIGIFFGITSLYTNILNEIKKVDKFYKKRIKFDY